MVVRIENLYTLILKNELQRIQLLLFFSLKEVHEMETIIFKM